MSNLRQLGAAGQLYAGDHDGCLIPMCAGNADASNPQTWRALVAPYLGSGDGRLFVCPADSIGRLSTDSTSSDGLSPTSYGMPDQTPFYPNYLNNFLGTVTNRKILAVHNPSSTIFLCDLGYPDNPGADPSLWTENNHSPGAANFGYARFPDEAGDPWDAFPRHGHRTKLNAVFYDGHAESLNWKKDIVANPIGAPGCLYDNH